ncbi:MAG: protein-glutamate O-methyltransferase CheR [Clostridiales bacterium]|jgi:chemotaxis protein methyltransferase CheR|nr:protein-glutamate O-methyltransferase CheR [Clostridiales bacterium]
MIKIDDRDFKEFTGFLKQNFGINMTKKRTLIEGRLNNYLLRNGYSDYSTYLKTLFEDPTGAEVNNVINYLTTNYSFFMREWDHFEFYKSAILPEWKAKITNYDLRVWSAGCSTGEEPYMLAILTDEFFESQRTMWDKKILATDISEKVLAQARRGVYDVSSLEKVSKKWITNYFDRLDKNHYQVKEAIRNEVIYRRFNLMEGAFPFKKKFHVIFCRNVMIYFDMETKQRLVQKYYDVLENGGYLIVGQSESIDRATSRFVYVAPAIYKKPHK